MTWVSQFAKSFLSQTNKTTILLSYKLWSASMEPLKRVNPTYSAFPLTRILLQAPIFLENLILNNSGNRFTLKWIDVFRAKLAENLVPLLCFEFCPTFRHFCLIPLLTLANKFIQGNIGTLDTHFKFQPSSRVLTILYQCRGYDGYFCVKILERLTHILSFNHPLEF